MIFHENERCPVCDNFFNDTDDIVICPQCGTPHHRECYNELGHCKNRDRHSEGFEYKFDTDSINDKSTVNDNYFNPNNVYYQPKDKEQANEGETEKSPEPTIITPFKADTRYDKSEDTIDGKKISEVAAVVRTNTSRFIPKFKKNKAVSWNWSAFIFGPYYLFFRKMTMLGAIFLALGLIVQLVALGVYMEPYTAYMQFISENASNYSELMNLMTTKADEITKLTSAVQPLFSIVAGFSLVSRVIIALFADKMYRSKVLKLLDNVNDKLENGGSFNQNPMFEINSNLTQEQMKKLYLGKLGGTSIFLPLIAMLVLDIINQIISRL